ncbi:MAG: aminotransferase class III-fold pyridoxal phosphate-dependent enzyme, partial [Saprospiraceae bacterium]
MPNNISPRQVFLDHVAQTSPFPLQLQIEKAKGLYLYDTTGKEYMDMIAGISVSCLGHCHPKVVEAVQKQAETFMHTLV